MPGRLEATHVTDEAAAPMRALPRAMLRVGEVAVGDAIEAL